LSVPEPTSSRLHSLAWRLILPLPLTLIAAIAAIWVIVPRVVEDNATKAAILASQQVATQFKIFRTYYTESIVGKVVKESALQPSFDHKTNDKAIPLPATLMHDLSALLADKDTTVNLYSKYPFPNRKDRQLDAYQQQAWDFLVANPKATFIRNETRNGKEFVRVAIADTMSAAACVDCHNTSPTSPKKDWKLGDVRGVLEVSSVIDAQLASELSNDIILGAVIIGIILLGVTLLATRSVTAPLTGLVGAMRRLAAGSFEGLLPGLDRKDEIGEMAGAVEMFKVKAIEQARRESEQEEAARLAAEVDRKAQMQRLADSFVAHLWKHEKIFQVESWSPAPRGVVVEEEGKSCGHAVPFGNHAAEFWFRPKAIAQQIFLGCHDSFRFALVFSQPVDEIQNQSGVSYGCISNG